MNPFDMKLLDFRLHDFTRYSWASDLARNVWQPRFEKIMAWWERVEWLSVAAGLRGCALKIVHAAALPELSDEMRRHGLSTAPLGKVSATQASYAATQTEAKDGGPFAYRVVVGPAANVEQFQSAWNANRQAEVGALLGYPACCADFFERVWCEERLIDTTWPMARNTASKTATGERVISVECAPQANILLRWLGLRAVFHLPCRFDCEATVGMADQLLALGREEGYAREVEWLLEALSWPVEWSALHGIAEVKTPVLKVAALTDATAEKYVVRRQGCSYPAEGARGLTFPYTRPLRLRLSDSEGFRRGVRNPIHVSSIGRRERAEKSEWFYADNGFASESDMHAAHEPVLKLAASALAGAQGPVLDLGCGNGALLRKIRHLCPSTVPFGVEIDAAKVAHARALLPEFACNFFAGDIFETDAPWAEGRRYALVILMLGRLLEVSREGADRLTSRLKQHAGTLLVYSYDAAGSPGDPLRPLAEKAGLWLLTSNEPAHVRLAAIP